MSDGDALLWSVLVAPADDAPRLVYADWLDDQGQHERAEFIRLQIELWRVGDGPASGRAGTLGARAEELFRRRVPGPGRRRAPAREVWAAPAGSGQSVRFARGFVAWVGCTGRWLVDWARPLFRTHPVETVVLTNKDPYHSRDLADAENPWVWMYNDPQRAALSPVCIPDPLFGLLRGSGAGSGLGTRRAYPTDAAARADLTVAAVAYGRKAAGLSPAPKATPAGIAVSDEVTDTVRGSCSGEDRPGSPTTRCS